jgi:hypothetical protein
MSISILMGCCCMTIKYPVRKYLKYLTKMREYELLSLGDCRDLMAELSKVREKWERIEEIIQAREGTLKFTKGEEKR